MTDEVYAEFRKKVQMLPSLKEDVQGRHGRLKLLRPIRNYSRIRR